MTGNVPSVCGVRRLPHLHGEETLVEIGQVLERGLGKIDMLGALSTPLAGVDNAGKDTLLRRVAHCRREDALREPVRASKN